MATANAAIVEVSFVFAHPLIFCWTESSILNANIPRDTAGMASYLQLMQMMGPSNRNQLMKDPWKGVCEDLSLLILILYWDPLAYFLFGRESTLE